MLMCSMMALDRRADLALKPGAQKCIDDQTAGQQRRTGMLNLLGGPARHRMDRPSMAWTILKLMAASPWSWSGAAASRIAR